MAENRFGGLRSSEGYDTDGKEEFEYRLQFRFDHSNVDATYRQVKKDLSDFAYELNKTFSSESIARSKTSSTMFSLSPKQVAKLPMAAGGTLDQFFMLVPDGKRIQDALQPAMMQIGEDGKLTMRKYANRVDTGRMKASIRYSTRKLAGSYIVNIGWTELWLKYFGFQENGTRTVAPMRSILRTYLEMVPRVQNFMSRFIRTYTSSKGKGVNYR